LRILLVGGQGFIGSTLAQELIFRGHDVSLAGRSHTKSLLCGIQEVIYWDASEEWSLATPRFDAVVHLASSNGSGSLDTLATYTNNVAVTRNVVDLCKRIDEASLMYVSTFQVLGRWSGVLDDQTPALPKTDYGFCHLVAEEHAKMFARVCDRKVLVARPTNIVGVSGNPDAIRWDTVPAEFCRQAIVDERIVLRSTGSQHRDFLSVQDLALRLAMLLEVHQVWDCRTHLIGSGRSVAVAAVADMVTSSVERQFGKCVEVEKHGDEFLSRNSQKDLNLVSSKFQGIDLVSTVTKSLECVVDELVSRAVEVFDG